MDLFFNIKRDLPEPYFEMTDDGLAQHYPLEFRDMNLTLELFNHIEKIWTLKSKMNTYEFYKLAKKYPQIARIKSKILDKLNNNKTRFVNSLLNYHLVELRPAT